MVNEKHSLDNVFGALANPVRRQTLELLGAGARTVSELASPYDMTLGGYMKHLRVLSDAGLIECIKERRTVTCALVSEPLSDASRWLADREKSLNARLDALGRHLYHREQIQSKPEKPASGKRRSR